MKKMKNWVLLIGIACVFMAVIGQIVKLFSYYFNTLYSNNLKTLTIWDVSPVLIILLLQIIPIFLLLQNLKSKTGKILPFVCLTINCVTFLWVMFSSFTSTVPQYLVINKWGIIQTYLVALEGFLSNVGILFIIGYVMIIIGSFLSLTKKNNEKSQDRSTYYERK